MAGTREGHTQWGMLTGTNTAQQGEQAGSYSELPENMQGSGGKYPITDPPSGSNKQELDQVSTTHGGLQEACW